MNVLENDSCFRIRLDFSLSEMDQDVLSFLYLPFLKEDAYSLYLSFYRYNSLLKTSVYERSEEFLSLLGFDVSSFLLARRKLEGVGLLETYRKEEKDERGGRKVTYCYSLFPPASPKKFFNDVLLRSLLAQSVGEKRYISLCSYFKAGEGKPEEGFLNMSCKFNDVYSLSVKDGDVSLSPVLDPMEDKKYKKQFSFDKEKFLSLLKKHQVPLNSLEKSLPDIEDAAVLYGISPEDLLPLILNSMDSSNIFYPQKFLQAVRDFHHYETPIEVSRDTGIAPISDSKIAKVIEGFRSLTPEGYLAIMYNGKPSPYMLEEIEHLRKDLGMENAVINALLDYSLKKTKMEFNTKFIDKVAYTLSANNIQDPYSAMVALSSRDFNVGSYSKNSKTKKENPKKEEEVEEKEVDDLLKDIAL